MEVFNKFYSSVSNTVSQLSGVLPGNPVTREFEATQFIASAGPGKNLLMYIFKICIQAFACEYYLLCTIFDLILTPFVYFWDSSMWYRQNGGGDQYLIYL